jgi:hypothetical protein
MFVVSLPNLLFKYPDLAINGRMIDNFGRNYLCMIQQTELPDGQLIKTEDVASGTKPQPNNRIAQ